MTLSVQLSNHAKTKLQVHTEESVMIQNQVQDTSVFAMMDMVASIVHKVST